MGLRVQGSMVEGVGFGVDALGSRGSGLRIGLGFRVQGLRVYRAHSKVLG